MPSETDITASDTSTGNTKWTNREWHPSPSVIVECTDLRRRDCFSRWAKGRARIRTLAALEREQSVTTIDNYDSFCYPNRSPTAALTSQSPQRHSSPLPSATDVHSPDTPLPSNPRCPLSLPSPFSSPLNPQPISNNRVCPVVRKHQRSATAKKRRQKLKRERKRLRQVGVQCSLD